MNINVFSKSDIILIKRSAYYIKPYKFKYCLAFLCVMLEIGLSLAFTMLWAKLLTSLYMKNFNKTLLLFIIAICIMESVIGFFQSYLFSYLSENIIYNLKRDMYSQILNLPIKAFDEMRVGDFISRLQEDASIIANVITGEFVNNVINIFRVIIIGVTVFTISWQLALIVVITFPFSYFIFLKYGKKIRKKNKEIAKLNDNYFSNVQESITGIREVKSLGVKKNCFESFLLLLKDLRNKSIGISVLNNFSQMLSQGVKTISQILVIVIGAYLIWKNSLTVEYFIAFTAYSGQFTEAIMQITKLNSRIQQALTSLERAFGLIDNLSYKQEEYVNKSVSEVNGNIKFEDVYFSYNEDNPVLNGVSFEVQCGEKTAIVGLNGSGKTTILNLLLRYYNPVKGSIYIDNININNFDEESLRKHIAIVNQEPFLFNRSIKDNFLLIKPDAAEEEIQQACKAAYIHDFIMNLPEKYNTVIGENGTNLSGGQRQRIAVARAFFKDSKIILFDEATSALDNESQYYIQEAINNISKTHTVLIIAHRFSTIIEADKILIIEDGKIMSQGTHESLLNNNSLYKRLFKTELSVITES
ncbi:ABC transporter [Clostridium botulinum]|uniref:ABC transporter ATP-binding protein n=1 Tax=Clostridium botulinum TaxID=1491 RepID=UPI000A175486|nr:ABC transporter ATP-binding protein [Clostridium botulinum]AUN16977.1 ABC transporter [Clostridium botulinum]OSA84378.1 ABC transporter [Clostridium botulinum]